MKYFENHFPIIETGWTKFPCESFLVSVAGPQPLTTLSTFLIFSSHQQEGAPEQDTSECGGDAGTSTVSTALPALGAFAMQEDAQPDDPQLEDPQPEDPQLEDLHPEAERSELPQLAGSHTADAGKRPSQASEGVKVADAPVPLPKIGSTEVVDSALATAEPQTPRDATMLPCAAAPPATVPEGAVPEGAAAVRKARKKRLIMAPKVRLPPLAALNRKNTVALAAEGRGLKGCGWVSVGVGPFSDLVKFIFPH